SYRPVTNSVRRTNLLHSGSTRGRYLPTTLRLVAAQNPITASATATVTNGEANAGRARSRPLASSDSTSRYRYALAPSSDAGRVARQNSTNSRCATRRRGGRNVSASENE